MFRVPLKLALLSVILSGLVVATTTAAQTEPDPYITPSPFPTSTPTPAPIICEPGSKICIDPPLDSINPSRIEICNSLGTAYLSPTYCSDSQICDSSHTSCIYPIVNPPDPECLSGAIKCENGRKFQCVQGEWTPYADSSGCQISPTSPPQLRLLNLPLQHPLRPQYTCIPPPTPTLPPSPVTKAPTLAPKPLS